MKTLFLLLSVLCAVVVVACSDEAPAPAGASSGIVRPPPTTIDPDASLQDAAAVTPRPELCEGIEPGGNVVPELELAGDPPAALGGVVAEGIYDLASFNAYSKRTGPLAPDAGEEEPPSTRKTGNAAQITIVVTRFEMRIVERRGSVDALGAAARRAYLYRTEGTELVRTPVCPTTSLPERVSYSAVNGGLSLLTDPTHREVYVRRSP